MCLQRLRKLGFGAFRRSFPALLEASQGATVQQLRCLVFEGPMALMLLHFQACAVNRLSHRHALLSLFHEACNLRMSQPKELEQSHGLVCDNMDCGETALLTRRRCRRPPGRPGTTIATTSTAAAANTIAITTASEAAMVMMMIMMRRRMVMMIMMMITMKMMMIVKKKIMMMMMMMRMVMMTRCRRRRRLQLVCWSHY